MSQTPKSDTVMPDRDFGPSGVKRSSVMDGESANCTEAFDGKNVVMPLQEMNHLKDAAGQA